MTRRLLLVVLFALALAGCTKKGAQKPKGIGKQVAAGAARNLSATSDGAMLAFVADVKPPEERDVPEGLFTGTLAVVPTAGGEARRMGAGVSTLEDGYKLANDGKHIAFLSGFRFRDQAGTLEMAALPSGDAKPVAEEVRFYGFSPDGARLAYVASGDMHLREVSSGAERIVAKNASTFEFSRDGKHVLVRKPLAAGGSLLLAETDADKEPKKLGDLVGEYQFSPDGKAVAWTARAGGPSEPYELWIDALAGGTPTKIAEGVSLFHFSPDGQWLAYIDGVKVSRNFGDLELAPAKGGASRQLGKDVTDLRWSPSSNAVAFRENHDDNKGHTWIDLKYVKIPDGQVKKLATYPPKNPPNFGFSEDGRRFAFLQWQKKPDNSLELNLYALTVGDDEPKIVDSGAFSFFFPGKGNDVWYLSNCVGRECKLKSMTPGAPAPKSLVEGIWQFRASKNGERLLVSYPRVDTTAAYDLGYVDVNAQAPSKGVDQYTLPGALFLDDAGKRVAYIVGERKREGVYVAELP